MFFSCSKSANEKKQDTEYDIVNENNNISTSDSVFIITDGDFDILTEYYWSISDGRYLENRSVEIYDWVGPMTPRVTFRNLDMPERSDLYQVRLRYELFYFLYHLKEENDNLYPIGSIMGTDHFEIKFRDNYSHLTRNRNGYFFNAGDRIGEQISLENPLVGIWGRLPSLNEYRLIDDPADSLLYMEIDRDIPFFAIRHGTYLLKQIDEKTFETVSSFPDGLLRLEIKSEREILLRPLFTLDEEEELVGLLAMHRSLSKISEMDEDFYY